MRVVDFHKSGGEIAIDLDERAASCVCVNVSTTQAAAFSVNAACYATGGLGPHLQNNRERIDIDMCS
jgi:hypothetical protein